MEALRKEIEQVLKPVGFRSGELPSHGEVPPPDGACFWISSYAIVALCPVPDSNLDKRAILVDDCETWLEALTTSLENQKRGFLDAYLLLGLTEQPDETMLSWARENARSTRFSRKQVVWLQASSDATRPPRTSTISVAEIPIRFVEPTDTVAGAFMDSRGYFPEWMLEILKTDGKDIPGLAKQFLEGVGHVE